LILSIDSHPVLRRAVHPGGDGCDHAAQRTQRLDPTRSAQADVSTFNDNTSYCVSSDPGDAPASGRYQSLPGLVEQREQSTHLHEAIRIQSMNANGYMQVRVN
jgi:hypothetical protein